MKFRGGCGSSACLSWVLSAVESFSGSLVVPRSMIVEESGGWSTGLLTVREGERGASTGSLYSILRTRASRRVCFLCRNVVRRDGRAPSGQPLIPAYSTVRYASHRFIFGLALCQPDSCTHSIRAVEVDGRWVQSPASLPAIPRILRR
jgi:hypothetical protein